jgi:hypothetical protein
VLGHGQVSDLGVVEKPEQVHVRVQASERQDVDRDAGARLDP